MSVSPSGVLDLGSFTDVALGSDTVDPLVVVDGNGNTDAASLLADGGPGDPSFPGFANVGSTTISSSSAIWIGGGWVLTANHVGTSGGGVVFGGVAYPIDTATPAVQLHNADSSPADVKMFKIIGDPGLPTISDAYLASSAPSGQVYMVGNGLSMGTEHFWSVNKTVSPWVWTETSAPSNPGPNDYAGFNIVSSRVIRWGENNVADTGIYLNLGGGTFITAFTTQFDDIKYTGQPGLTYEAHASSGDSGGAVFDFVGGKWVLTGIMNAISGPLSGQPSSTILYGNETYMTDLSAYRDQILSIAGIVGRHVVYNNSIYDGNTSAPTAADDAAIAPDKFAYLPGQGPATFDNITSYARGINGVMVDVASSHGALTLSDFSFKVGNDNVPGNWATAATPTGFLVRAGAGAGGSDRIEITWADGAISNTWLEVTVEGNDATGGFNTNTGLAASDVFYFGNRIGDAGSGTTTLAITSAVDELGARNNLGAGAEITNVYDFDRSGAVTAVDPIVSRLNAGTLLKIDISDAINVSVAPAAAAEEEATMALALTQPLAEPNRSPHAPKAELPTSRAPHARPATARDQAFALWIADRLAPLSTPESAANAAFEIGESEYWLDALIAAVAEFS